MPKLPQGVFTRRDRPGFWHRDRREGRDRWCSHPRASEAKAHREQVKGGAPMPAKITVQKLAQNWLDRYVATARNEKGQALASQRVRDFLVPELGARRIAALRRDDLRTYRLALERRSLTPQTVAHVLSDARCFLAWAVEAEWIPASPFPKDLLPKIQEQAPDRLSEDEAQAIASLPEPWGFYCRLLLGTGMRWTEATTTTTQSVVRGMLEVTVQTKSRKLRRIPLSPALLADIQKDRIGRLLPFGPRGSAHFARRVTKLSGVERFGAHRCRHTFACRFIDAGGSLEALQEVLGHASIKVTQRYAKLSEGAVIREAERAWG